MSYRIIADSSCDMNDEIKSKVDIELIPFRISVDGKEYVDNENLDLKDMMNTMIASPNPIKTSCPAPGDFLEAFKGEDDCFVVTISSRLSGAYNSAVLAKEMALEENSNRFIHVFDSKSASIGETLVALKIKECKDEGLSNEDVVKEVDKFIADLTTMFTLESLDNLIKNGRISKTKGLIASVLNFKPIMGSEDGEILLEENVRGSKKAFNKLVEIIGSKGKDLSQKT